MLGCFPILLPDELLYSAIAAWKDRLSLKDKRAIKTAFGEKTRTVIYDLPTNLLYFINQLPPYYNLTIDDLINNHTLYPYYASTLPLDRKEKLWNMMCQYNSIGIYLLSGITGSFVNSPIYLRYCPQCIDYDSITYGRAYWHRTHQLMSVLLCPIHLIFLKDSDVRVRFRKTNDKLFISSPKIKSTINQDNNMYSDVYQKLIYLTHNSSYLLKFPNTVFNSLEMRYKYQFLFQRNNLYKPRSNSYMIEFVTEFIKYYSSDLLEYIGCNLDTRELHSWVRRASNGEVSSMHPTYHILLISFFELSVDQFLQLPNIQVEPRSFSRMNTSEYIPWRRSREGYIRYVRRDKKYDWGRRDTHIYNLLQPILRQLQSSQEKPQRLSISSICRHLGEREIPPILKNLYRLPQTAKLLATLVDTTDSYCLRAVAWARLQCLSSRTHMTRHAFLKLAGISSINLSDSVVQAVTMALQEISSQ